MAKDSLKKYLYLWVICFAALLVIYGYEINDIYQSKINEQISINKNASQVKETYEALLPTIDQWNKKYTSSNEVIDIISLYKALNVESTGLIPSSQDLSEGNVTMINYHNLDLGLMKRCLKNTSSGFTVESTSLSHLVNGIKRIDDRFDISWDSININVKNGKPLATFKELCVNLRVEG